MAIIVVSIIKNNWYLEGISVLLFLLVFVWASPTSMLVCVWTQWLEAPSYRTWFEVLKNSNMLFLYLDSNLKVLIYIMFYSCFSKWLIHLEVYHQTIWCSHITWQTVLCMSIYICVPKCMQQLSPYMLTSRTQPRTHTH